MMLIVFALLLVLMPRSSLVTAQLTVLTNMCYNEPNYTDGSNFQTNLYCVLFNSLYIDSSNSIFSNRTEGQDPDTVYGLFLCVGNVSATDCQECVYSASETILSLCRFRKEGIIWLNQCMLRYSYKSTFPATCSNDTGNITKPDNFNKTADDMFANLIPIATSNRMYATNESDIGNSTKVRCTVQCLPDLSPVLCSNCLNQILNPGYFCSAGKYAGFILTPSCYARSELYQFVHETSGSSGKDGKMIAISVSISASVVFLLIGSVIYYQRRRKRATEEKKGRSSQEVQLLDLAQLRIVNDFNAENFEGERPVKSQDFPNFEGERPVKSQDFPSVQLDLILEATKQFSKENKLGEGGFGPVYKGTLPDGKEIAVKRVSRNSGQGFQEFKNEISLIARLQHRNLVRLLGCCLEGNELMLIYEYMPNKSLDFFLFDSAKATQLDWSRRFLIINGIARGLLYLHEDSRLRIIHRDLKVSNILLDQEMNPKISDFGMARIFGGNQSEANTNRVVGTYGYMAPEYAMEGLFSIKSDVFSFGVLLLEIISGKKNCGFYLSEHGHNLLTYTWNLWCKGEGKLELMDPLIVESCVEAEVLKCIQIGLLCVQEDPADRPTMSSVVHMLGSDIATLPQPTQPTFSVKRLVLKSCQFSPNVNVVSVNELTISNVSPR